MSEKGKFWMGYCDIPVPDPAYTYVDNQYAKQILSGAAGENFECRQAKQPPF